MTASSTLPTSQHAFGQDNFISFGEDDRNQDSNPDSLTRDNSKSKSKSANQSKSQSQSQPASASASSNSKGKKRKFDEREEPQNSGPNGWGKAEELKAMARGTPWTRDIQWHACRNAPEMLHRELMAFDAWISPTFEEHETRVMVIELISKAIKSHWPDAKVHSFGSHDTKLYLPQGDIDIVILSNAMKHERTPQTLSTIASLLRKANLASNIQVLSKARVPIIKFVCNHGKYKVDISLNMTNGITAASFVNKWLKKQPAIRPLILFVKHLLDQRGLSEVFTGGLGSYSVILITISFFQTHPKIQRGEISASRNLGVLLLDMLELYGINYVYDQVGISVNRGGYFRKDSKSYDFFAKPYRPFTLSIEDPQDPTNDISRGTYNLQGVREALAGALNRLVSEMCRRGIEKQKFSNSHVRFNPREEEIRDPIDRDEEARRELLKQNEEIRSTGKDPMSLLGNVLGVTRELINQRKNIHELYHSGTLQHKLNRPPPSMDPQPGPASSSNSRDRIETSRLPSSKSARARDQSPRLSSRRPTSISDSNGNSTASRSFRQESGGYSIAGRASKRDVTQDVIRQAEKASDVRPSSRNVSKAASSRIHDSNKYQAIRVDDSDDEELDSRYVSLGSTNHKKGKSPNGNHLSKSHSRSTSYISHDSDSASDSSLNHQDDDDEDLSFPTMASNHSNSTSRHGHGSSSNPTATSTGVKKVLQSDRKPNGKYKKISRGERDSFWTNKGNLDPGVDEYDHWSSYLDEQGDN